MSLASNSHPPRKHLWILLLLVSLALGSIAAGPPYLRSGYDQPLRLAPADIQALSEIKAGPQIDALAAIIVDRRSNTVLWSRNADMAVPMASTTKLMTALLALQVLQPDDVVVVSSAALVGNASMGLQAGEQISVRALLYGALMVSGNDAATELAIAAAGNVPAFVQRMNEQALAWGMKDTHFVNPHGLDAPGHVSSARDLVTLAQHVLENPLLAEIVATRRTTIAGYTLVSTNQLLGTYEGVYGVKTGTTDAAGQVLIAAARRPGGDVITVVLNSPDRFTETTRLLDYYFEHWRWVTIQLRPDVLNTVRGPNGSLFALTGPSRPLLLERWQIPQLRLYRSLSFDLNSQPAGLLQVWLAEQKLLETPLDFKLLLAPTTAPHPTTVPKATPLSFRK
ncbi:MAG: D-alanyl-D-alanine carboxypeptidase [Chloroflexi bacterium]|nr:D-alanyl-D-alanine carboxypeptidase [Chloroflexota bacterium]